MIDCANISLPASFANRMAGWRYLGSVTAIPSGSHIYTSSEMLPSGLTLRGNSGFLYGTPTMPGIYTFTITATAGSCSGAKQYTVTIGGNSPTLSRVVNDFDGDGRSDFALWSEKEKDWTIIKSGDGEIRTAGWRVGYDPRDDALVFGDYDGDGKYDLAIFRRSTGEWPIQRSTDGVIIAERWSDGTPVPATTTVMEGPTSLSSRTHLVSG